jgi:hypothetical protein
MDAKNIIDAVQKVTGKWAKQRKSEERDAGRALSRRASLVRSYRVTIKDAAWRVMEEAYLHASSGGRYPAHARQIMYAARPKILRVIEQNGLDDQYFTQTLLPDYMTEHPTKTARWNVVFDARGHFEEPHTGRVVPLGTLEVREYLRDLAATPGELERERIDCQFPTAGPRGRFGAVLFIEKEGFMPLLRAARLAERYDVAIMSTKGLSVTASRLLVDRMCGAHRVPLLVLHDFDKAGFSIFGTLKRDTRRYEFSNKVETIDLGLRLQDVRDWNLQDEATFYRGRKNPAHNLRANFASDEEVGFLVGRGTPTGYHGRRVELNAFASGDFIAWIEGKLKRHGVRKVTPDGQLLETAFRRAHAAVRINRRLEEIMEEALEEAVEVSVPEGLAGKIRARLEASPELSWDTALEAIVAEEQSDRGVE